MRLTKKFLFAAALAGILGSAFLPSLARAQLVPPGAANFKNLLICGDFGTCPWQKGTSTVGGDIAATAVYTADQWVCWGGTSTAIDISQNTTAADLPPATQAVFQFQRKASNGITLPLSCAQILETADTIPLQRNPISVQFWAAHGASWSATTGLTVKVVTGTGTDEGSAALATASWTGQATSSTATVGTSAIGASTSQFYAGQSGGPYAGLTFTMPATATEVALVFTWTPVGTAGATDWIALANIQMEQNATPTTFERRKAEVELALAQRYFYKIVEAASPNYQAHGVGGSISASDAHLLVPFPVPMRTVPTMAYGNGFAATGAAGSAEVCATIASVANSIGPRGVVVDCASGGNFTINQPSILVDQGGTGSISAAAQL